MVRRGSVAGGAAVATTWFGSNPEYVHGINCLPVLTGLTDLLIDGEDACACARPFPGFVIPPSSGS